MYKGRYTGTLIEDSINSTLINADIPSRVSALEELVRNLQSGSSGGGGTIPSNLYLSRLLDDFANGLITFNLGVKIGRFVTGTTGGCFSVDNLGKTSIEVDKLYVRLKAYFETLEIIHTNSVRGRWMITPGGSIKIIKVETNNINSAVPENVYRCYFDVDDGDTAVTNPFVENDLIQCKSFNIKPGIYQHVSNKYYWRAVVGVPDTNGNYVDLSMILSDTGSDIPEAGDVICLLGNTTNIDRQSAIVYSTVDTFSPSCSLYLGINDFTFDGKDYISYGVNATTKKAFFNVYGDTFIGNRPDALGNSTSYIKYTTQNGVELKGKLSVGTTVGDKDLSLKLDELSSSSEDYDAFKLAVLIDLLNILNQVDGAIETWYYEGEPSSTAIPENSWLATDTSNGNNNIRNSHIGDLYYDQLTGKAYRYQYDNTTGFYWRLITDTDIIKALEDARKAQDTADSKRKIFVVTPTNDSTYDIGDLWLNATYPAGTTTTNVEANLYYNETLRAVTAKDANTIFNINHWILASKYTDDTVANEAIRQIGELSTDLSNLGTTVSNFLNEVNTTFKDGIINTLEKATLNTYIKNINTTVSGIEALYNAVYGNSLLNEVNELGEIVGDSVEKIALNNAWLAFVAAKLDLLDTITSVISDNIISAIEIDLVNVKFSNFNNKYGVLVSAINAANNYMLGKLSIRIDNTLSLIGTFNYLKEVFAQKTEIVGGLVLTSVVALRDSSDNITAGINGLYDTIKGDKTAAIWFGGANVDMFDHLKLDGTLDMDNMPANHARGMDRMDGSGYRANGNLWWDTEGRVHADPLSFFVGENQMGLSSALFLFIPKEGVTNIISLNDVSYVVPLLNFNHLNALDYLQIGSVARFKYNSANNAIYIEKEDGTPVNFYATGGITALGYGSVHTSGGASHLYELEDINLNLPTEGLFLKYDGTNWINADIVIPTLSWNNIVDKPTSFNPSIHVHNISDINNLPNILNTKAAIATTLAGYGITDSVTSSLFDSCVSVLQAQIDSLSKKNQFDELFASHIAADTVSADRFFGKLDWTDLINKPTTLAGYGIVDAAPLSHISDSIKHITSIERNNWNTAYTNNHTHSNKAALDKITLDVDGNIMIDGNLYTTGGLSALGLGVGGSGGGGIDETLMWSILGNTGTEQIASNHLSTALSGYATQTWVSSNFNNYTLTKSAIEVLLTGNITTHNHDRLTGMAEGSPSTSPSSYQMLYQSKVYITDTGSLPAVNNANGILTFNTHEGNYYAQLGFSSNGRLYHRNFDNIALDTTTAWNNIAFLSDIPTSLPASDVYAWAKASIKPSYTYSEVGAAPTIHTHNSLFVSDTRDTVTTPETIDRGVVFDFKNCSVEGLPDGGTYFGEMTFRRWGGNSDWTGGSSHQLGFTDNDNIWLRTGGYTTWGTWHKLFHSGNFTNLNQLTTRNFSDIQNRPTTLPGYGITDALSLYGGTLTGELTLSIAGLTVDNFIKFKNDTQNCYFGIRNPYNSFGLTFVSPNGTYNKVWHSGNNGSGSGLDADLLDGRHLKSIIGFDTKRDFINGTLITTNIDYSASEGDPFYLEIKGNAYTRWYPCLTQAQGYIYNNTIVNYGVTHVGYTGIYGLVALNVNGNLCFWFPRQGYWEGYSIFVSSAFATSYNRVTAIDDVVKPTGTKEVIISEHTTTSAYIDSNVASATKLQTARTIAGVSFDGTINIDIPFANLIGKPTTLAGYGITDAVQARTRGNWNDNTVVNNVVGQLTWKAYGNEHTIFDASNGFSPSGTSCNSADSNIAWSNTYPTLMGWNGANTYGVRVDTARYAESAAYTTKLKRRDSSDNYFLQHHWTGEYWYLRGYFGDNFHAEVQVGYANNAGNADLLDGVQYQNILERSYSCTSSSGNATGWFRIGVVTESNFGGQSFILKIKRNYESTNNESYSFSISAAYNGGINITQLSGFANTRLIDKIRLDYTNGGNTYIDLHISTSTAGNSYYWTTIGGATSYTSWTAVSDTPTGTAYEFTTVNGVKSDRGFTGDIAGNSSTATKLATARTIWGQSFDGSGNVDGTLYINPGNAGNYTEGLRIKSAQDGWSLILLGAQDLTSDAGTSPWSWGMFNCNGNFYINKSAAGEHTGYELCNINGNWGINTVTPEEKLDVIGNIRASGSLRVNDVISAGESIDDSYGIINVCRFSNNQDYSCFSLIEAGVSAYGIGFNKGGSGIWLGNVMAHSKIAGRKFLDLHYDLATFSGSITANGNILATSGVSALSDVRLKSDIQPLMNRGYLNPVSYIKDGKRDIGFIAQEVRDLYPELVYEGTDENKYLSLNYAQITAVLEAQIIELQKEINNLNLKLNNYGIL